MAKLSSLAFILMFFGMSAYSFVNVGNIQERSCNIRCSVRCRCDFGNSDQLRHHKTHNLIGSGSLPESRWTATLKFQKMTHVALRISMTSSQINPNLSKDGKLGSASQQHPRRSFLGLALSIAIPAFSRPLIGFTEEQGEICAPCTSSWLKRTNLGGPGRCIMEDSAEDGLRWRRQRRPSSSDTTAEPFPRPFVLYLTRFLLN